VLYIIFSIVGRLISLAYLTIYKELYSSEKRKGTSENVTKYERIKHIIQIRVFLL